MLTLEAFELYLQHLREDGVIATNISNRHVDLRPVLAATAKELGLELVYIDKRFSQRLGDRTQECDSRWGVMARPGRLDTIKEVCPVQLPETVDSSHLWTDDYSNIFRLIPLSGQ